MLSLNIRHHAAAHPGCKLRWDEHDVALAAQELSSADFIPARPPLSPRRTFTSKPAPSSALSRSNTAASTSMTMTLSADVGVLLTRHVRRESTYIVWGGLLAFEPPPAAAATAAAAAVAVDARAPLRAVLVKIAVDDEGGEDLRELARHYEALAERGLYVGYHGLFGDRIGSTALVVEDLGDGEEDSSSLRSASP
ncbi:hypothetical protein BC628DRAFT_1412107 [Trametes gibbosa]|nr:hypothetical protein BC628DRAFT_1412107 [Trametes gibbosa]